MNKTVSIITLFHNKADYSARCLDGMLRSTHGGVQLVMVDNGSTDGTPEVLDDAEARALERGWSVERIRFDENSGAIAGRNAALERSEGELIAFVDNDVAPRNLRWMEMLGERLAAEAELGIVGPKMIYPFRDAAAGDHLIQCAGCEVSPTGKVNFRGRGDVRSKPEWNEAAEVQCLISATWLMRREVYEELGELDERFNPVQFEDIDYCYRARYAEGRAGPEWRVGYEPSVEMYHFENVTSGRTQALNYRYLTVKNGLKFKEKWLHRCREENGRPESEMQWKFDLPQVSLDDVGELEFVA